MIHLSTLLKHYKRPEIQKEIVYAAEGREVAVRFEQGFGKRPDVLIYPQDVMEFAKQKATSFHFSEEHWRNPLDLKTSMNKNEMTDLRVGWDLVIDIDCHMLDYSKLAAKLVVQALEFHGIKSLSCKFSGNKGFHIAVPFESFPKEINGQKTAELFPEAARRIALYLREMIKNPLSEEIMKYEKGDFSSIIAKTGMEAGKITRIKMTKDGPVTVLNAEPFLDIDTVLISSRHLYRSVYSFNEKSGLVSIPVNPKKVAEFNIVTAKAENVRVSKFRFLDRDNAKTGEATKLFVQAYDFKPAIEQEKIETSHKNYDIDELADAIPLDYFPPCIKLILEGLKDGKKRSLFILVNFLSSLGWNYEQIEALLLEWNKKNLPAMREGDIKNHIRYHKLNKKKVLPPNCDNEAYYLNIGVCKPDGLCQRIKNPAQYAKVRFRNREIEKPKKEKKAKKETVKNEEKTD